MRHYGTLSTNSKKAPAGFKWCPRCAETKKLDDFYWQFRPRGREKKQTKVPDTICKACRLVAVARHKAKEKAAE